MVKPTRTYKIFKLDFVVCSRDGYNHKTSILDKHLFIVGAPQTRCLCRGPHLESIFMWQNFELVGSGCGTVDVPLLRIPEIPGSNPVIGKFY